MCNWCDLKSQDESERKRTIRQLEGLASDLTDMAGYLQSIRFGNLKPHTDDMKPVTIKAESLIRQLVAEFI